MEREAFRRWLLLFATRAVVPLGFLELLKVGETAQAIYEVYSVCACVRVCAHVHEYERVYTLSECMRERERERESVCVCVCVSECL